MSVNIKQVVKLTSAGQKQIPEEFISAKAGVFYSFFSNSRVLKNSFL
jgi:hypothetical protein